MGDFVAYNSRWRLALLLFGAVCFVLAGLWMGGIFGPPPHSGRYPDGEILVVGWLSVFFFGLCALAIVKKFFDPSEQLRIGPLGVRSRSWSEETIPWSEITNVTIWRYGRQKMIVLHLRNPDRFPGRGLAGMLAAANRKLTGGDITLNLTSTDRSVADTLSAIQRFKQ
jgi:hypothetical protein